MKPGELHRVLSLVLDTVDPETLGIKYRLGGTAAALAQGVQLPARDVDILVTRRADVDRFAAALSRFTCLVAPVWLPASRQYFARFEVEGIEVEVTTVEQAVDTDTFECVGPGPWEHFVEVRFGRHVVPVIRLELRLVSELVRDRPDRYEPLIEHMRCHGSDFQLVQRAMKDRAVDPALQELVLSRSSDAGGR
jgi:hypothetical protein